MTIINNQYLIADSGSTKTAWSLVKNDGTWLTYNTSGINPFFLNERDIIDLLTSEYKLASTDISTIYFYGAGCALPEKKQLVHNALQAYFGEVNIHINSDLLAAAHSLCGHKAGIACILGTGSNSCYYNGVEIEQNISPLGYTLGDEGSGAVLGKKLVADILKNQLPKNICDDFFATYATTPSDILENVYKKPFPNRYLAQFTRFIAKHIDNESIENIVYTSFNEFFIRNVCQYKQAVELPINFTGSIAHIFSDIIQKSANKLNLNIGTITQSPMQGLIDYHTNSSTYDRF